MYLEAEGSSEQRAGEGGGEQGCIQVYDPKNSLMKFDCSNLASLFFSNHHYINHNINHIRLVGKTQTDKYLELKTLVNEHCERHFLFIKLR